MRSSSLAERALGLVAAATLEGAWLTLAYVALEFASGASQLYLDVVAFALAALVGVVIAKWLGDAGREVYVAVAVGASMVAAVCGVVVGGIASLDPVGIGNAVQNHPAGWLLGIAVLRGAGHTDIHDEETVSERLLQRGLIGLVVFWLVAAVAHFERQPEFVTTAFSATISFVTSGLLSVGLARLTDLDVEAIDRAAKRRWIVLLLGVVALVLVVAIPVGAVIGVPIVAGIEGVAGPLAPVVFFIVSLVAIPIAFVISVVFGFLFGSGGGGQPIVLPIGSPLPSGDTAPPLVPPTPGTAPDLTGLLWLVTIVGITILFFAIARALGARREVEEDPEAVEFRQAEPIRLSLPELPRLRPRRARRGAPGDAVEAYRLALEALADRSEERRTHETPREHSRRIRGSVVGLPISRLAVDYELAALAQRRLSHREERRAIARWRAVLARLHR